MVARGSVGLTRKVGGEQREHKGREAGRGLSRRVYQQSWHIKWPHERVTASGCPSVKGQGRRQSIHNWVGPGGDVFEGGWRAGGR